MHFIDTLFSSTITMTIIAMVWLMLYVWLASYSPFKNKTVNYLYKGTMYVIACLMLIFPMFVYWGLAGSFQKMYVGRTTICLLDRYERGGAESMPETVNRLWVLDRNTGQNRYRSYIGYTGELLGMKGDTVVYLYNYDLHVMNAATLTEIYGIAKDDWSRLYPELADGVDQVNDNQNTDTPLPVLLTIRGKNGNNYFFDPFTKKLGTQDPGLKPSKSIYSTGYDIYFEPGNGQYRQALLRQESLPNSVKQKIMPGDKFGHMFGPPSEDGFIEPRFVCIDTLTRCFVFTHYKTTDKKQVWVECRDFDFKTRWKKDSGQLEATDSFNEDYVTAYALRSGLLYMNLGGFVFCMEPCSGQVRWKVRL